MQIAVGEIVEGKITGITNFGVFVDLGEGKSGMVHISEIALTYVNDIKEHVKLNDVVKMKVLNISEDGKISLSIKRALEQERRERPPVQRTSSRPAPFVGFGQPKSEPTNFEEMMNRFKQTSDEKFSDLKKKNADTRRPKRGSATR